MSSSMGRIIPYIMEHKKCSKPPTSKETHHWHQERTPNPFATRCPMKPAPTIKTVDCFLRKNSPRAEGQQLAQPNQTHTHTHAYIYLYIYRYKYLLYVYVYVYVYAYVYICICKYIYIYVYVYVYVYVHVYVYVYVYAYVYMYAYSCYVYHIRNTTFIRKTCLKQT